MLTDPSLQEEQLEGPRKRTVALCVSTSCVLTSSVVKALNSPAACCLLFRDAIREHGSNFAIHSILSQFNTTVDYRAQRFGLKKNKKVTIILQLDIAVDLFHSSYFDMK